MELPTRRNLLQRFLELRAQYVIPECRRGQHHVLFGIPGQNLLVALTPLTCGDLPFDGVANAGRRHLAVCHPFIPLFPSQEPNFILRALAMLRGLPIGGRVCICMC